MKLVLVTWEDASDDETTWVHRKDAQPAKVIIFQQVGWLIEATADHVLMTCAINDELIAARSRIPRGMVHSVIELDPNGKRVALPTRKPKAS